MYPKGSLINKEFNNLIVFEVDSMNPENEGFICFWSIKDSNTKELIFKKRISKVQAIAKWDDLIMKGWERYYEFLQAS